MNLPRKTSIYKIIPMVLIALYAILLGVSIAFINLPISKAILAFMAICSTMLLTDIGKTIKDTYNMDKGDFKKIYTPYYVVCALCSVGLILTILITQKQDMYSNELENLITSIGIVIAEYIGALLGNKIATGTSETVENVEESVGTDQGGK